MPTPTSILGKVILLIDVVDDLHGQDERCHKGK